MTLPLCPPGGGKGPVMGALPPFEAPFQTPESPPPYLALSIFVRCPPVPTKASLSEQAGAHIHPRMGGGMKSGQGCYPSCVPRPAVGGIAGVRARPEKNRAPGRVIRREGCRHDVGLGRAPSRPPAPLFLLFPARRAQGIEMEQARIKEISEALVMEFCCQLHRIYSKPARLDAGAFR